MKISEYSIKELKDEIARRKLIDDIDISITSKIRNEEINELQKEMNELHNGIKYKVMIGDFEVTFYVGWDEGMESSIFDISPADIVYKGKPQTKENKIIANAFRYYFEAINNHEVNGIEHFLNLEEVKKAQKEVNKKIKNLIKKSDSIAKQNNIDPTYFWNFWMNMKIKNL